MKRMKIITIFLSLCYLALSCNKECNNYNTKDILIGKIKSLTLYNYDSTYNLSKFYFFYDSHSGSLKSVDAYIKFQSVDTLIVDYINLVKSNSYIYIYDYNNNKYKIKVMDKQITTIYKTINATETLATLVYINNGIVDSIFDIGSFMQTNIFFSNFKYKDENCSSYLTNWFEFTGVEYVHKSDSLSFTFTNIPNKGTVFNQIIGNEFGGGSILNEIIYFLGIDGYYIIKPNLTLIDTLKNREKTTKYEYTVLNNLPTRVNQYSVATSVMDSSFQDITYY